MEQPFEHPGGFKTVINVNADAWKGPYPDLATALVFFSGNNAVMRENRTIEIIEGGIPVEYFWGSDVSDAGLKPKNGTEFYTHPNNFYITDINKLGGYYEVNGVKYAYLRILTAAEEWRSTFDYQPGEDVKIYVPGKGYRLFTRTAEPLTEPFINPLSDAGEYWYKPWAMGAGGSNTTEGVFFTVAPGVPVITIPGDVSIAETSAEISNAGVISPIPAQTLTVPLSAANTKRMDLIAVNYLTLVYQIVKGIEVGENLTAPTPSLPENCIFVRFLAVSDGTAAQADVDLSNYYTKEEIDTLVSTPAIPKTHAELIQMAAAGDLRTGLFYSYPYYAVYINPASGAIVKKTATTETFLVQAGSPSTFTNKAISTSFPSDLIEIDILNVSNGAVGVITKRTDPVKGLIAPEDWRNITYDRFNILGIRFANATLNADNLTFDVVLTDEILDATLNRYREFYIKLPNVPHLAAPKIKLTKGATIHEAFLNKTNGAAWAANELQTNSVDQLYLVYYSTVFSCFVAREAATENNLVKGHYSYNNTNFRLGQTNLMIDPNDKVERHLFGSRVPANFSNVSIGVRTGGLLNLTLESGFAVSNTYIAAESYNGHYKFLRPVTSLKLDSPTYNNIVIGSLSGSSVSGRAMQNNLIATAIINQDIKLLTVTDADYWNEFSGNSIFSPYPSTNPTLSHKIIRNTVFRMFFNSAYAENRAHYGSTFESYFNIENLFDLNKFVYLQNKAFEFGTNLQRNFIIGRRETIGISAPESYRTTGTSTVILDCELTKLTAEPPASTNPANARVLVRDVDGFMRTIPVPGNSETGVFLTGRTDGTATEIKVGEINLVAPESLFVRLFCSAANLSAGNAYDTEKQTRVIFFKYEALFRVSSYNANIVQGTGVSSPGNNRINALSPAGFRIAIHGTLPKVELFFAGEAGFIYDCKAELKVFKHVII